MEAVGSRVGAIMSAEGNTVRLFGYGVYEGDFIPDEKIAAFPFPNPKIVLDSNEIIYGFECWWGPEAAIKEYCKKFDLVEQVSITEHRASFLRAKSPEQQE